MGNWDQRENVENGEDDRMREKCYNARQGNIEIFLYPTRSCTRVHIITHFVQGIINYMIRAVEAAKQGIKVGEDRYVIRTTNVRG